MFFVTFGGVDYFFKFLNHYEGFKFSLGRTFWRECLRGESSKSWGFQDVIKKKRNVTWEGEYSPLHEIFF